MRNGDNEDSDYGDLPGSKRQLTLCLLGGGFRWTPSTFFLNREKRI